MSLYVSNIGSSSFIGMAGVASSSGIAVVSYEIMGLFCIQLLGFVFVPVYHASGVITMPEYVQRRFGGSRCQLYLAVQALILFVFTKLSAEIYAGALIIKASLGWDLYYSVLLLLGVTALYTIVGGLASVIYTDALQTVVIIIGATILAVLSMVDVGGYENMTRDFFAAVPSPDDVLRRNGSCGLAPSRALHLLRPADDADYPWPGVLIGINILSAWYFCTDQVLVQRLLAAKSTAHAQAGSILAGYMKVLPLFLMVWPGMISRIKFPDIVACASPEACEAACGVKEGCSNLAYVRLVIKLMPTGLKGLMLAAMMAALMSSLTSIFNSGSTLFTMDIWKKLRKSATERELMIVGRLFVLVFVGVSIAWLPMIETSQGGQLFNYLQSISSYLAPPVLAVYLLGILTTRANEQGAFWGLLSGLAIGIARMVADWLVPAPACGLEDTRPFILKDFHFLHFAILVFSLALVVAVAVSIVTPPPLPSQLHLTTWWTMTEDGAAHTQSNPTLAAHSNPTLAEDLDDEATPTRSDIIAGPSTEAAGSQAETEANPGAGTVGTAAANADAAETEAQSTTCKDILLSWICGSDIGSRSSKLEQQPGTTDGQPPTVMVGKESAALALIVRANLVTLICVGVFVFAFFA